MGNRKLKAANSPRSGQADPQKKRSKGKLFFEVSDYGAISEPNFREPKINREIFEVPIHMLATPEDIIFDVEYCSALLRHFRRLAAEKRDDLTRQVEVKNYRDDEDLKRMQRLSKELEDEDDG